MLSEILEKTSEGKLVLSNIGSNKILTKSLRELLVDAVVTYCLELKTSLTVGMCRDIVQQITTEFPQEVPVKTLTSHFDIAFTLIFLYI